VDAHFHRWFRLLGGFWCVLVFSSSPQAADPRRFLDIVKWRLTSTQHAQGSAQDPANGITASWSQSGQFTAELNVPLFPTIPFFFNSWVAEESAQGQITLNNVWENPAEPLRFTLKDDGFTGGNPQLAVDPVAKTYALYFPIGFRTLVQEIPVSGGGLWMPGGFVTNALPEAGLTLSGQMSWPILEAVRGNAAPIAMPFYGSTVFQGNLTVTWTLEPVVEEVEVVVEPEDYKDWLPKGNLEDPAKHGNLLFIKAKLQAVGGGAATLKATKFRFEFVKVSREPGVCMNLPINSPSTERDLQFEEEFNDLLDPSVTIQSEILAEVLDPLAAATGKGNLEQANAMVSAFDFGAYGELKVTAEVNGREIVGYWKDDPNKVRGPIRLPKRAPESFIADAWKEMEGVSALGDKDDEENVPAGDDHKGDGYSLYEEYRGFSENLKHARLKPKKKDLFILDRMGDAEAKREIMKFEKATQLKVRHELREDEMGEFNVMNVNHGGNPNHLHDQAGLRMVAATLRSGMLGRAQVDAGQPVNSTPGSHTQIQISMPETLFHADGTTGFFTTQNPLIYSAIAHELAHGCSVWHHGSSDDQPPKELKVIKSIVLGNPPSERLVARLNGENITLLNENGSPYDLAPLFREGGGKSVAVAYLKGKFSGHQDCFMRYRLYGVYTHDAGGGIYYWVENDPATGSILCASARGTGINAPKPGTPWPRYGDADEGLRRGNCKGQVCVNDKYKDDAKHARK